MGLTRLRMLTKEKGEAAPEKVRTQLTTDATCSENVMLRLDQPSEKLVSQQHELRRL